MNATLQRAQLPQVPGAEHVRATLTPILWSIADGTLRAGDEVRAPVLAARLRLGIPDVEDAIPRLAHLGLIQLPDKEYDEDYDEEDAEDDDEPAVMTSFSREQAIREVRGWAEVHLAMISTASRLRGAKLRRMQRVRDAYAERVAAGAPYAALNLVFFGILYEVTPNFGFRLATTSAAYRLRLSEDVLPQDPRKTTELHDALLAALRSDDVMFGAELAIRTWSGALTGKPLGW
ncbi:FCD domain-containing protein [Agromyces silvae]|uniref:FCD domain-containing protein n=1 Tax=Agromyces silvae TaxID=3388266 RepID=UPI00280B32DB|nr:FCD domain-containing protein [Agromyces protaetiae]